MFDLNTKIHLGKKLKELLQERKLTLQDIATKTKKSRQTIYNYTLKKELTLSQVKPICKALGIQVSYFGFSDNPNEMEIDPHGEIELYTIEKWIQNSTMNEENCQISYINFFFSKILTEIKKAKYSIRILYNITNSKHHRPLYPISDAITEYANAHHNYIKGIEEVLFSNPNILYQRIYQFSDSNKSETDDDLKRKIVNYVLKDHIEHFIELDKKQRDINIQISRNPITEYGAFIIDDQIIIQWSHTPYKNSYNEDYMIPSYLKIEKTSKVGINHINERLQIIVQKISNLSFNSLNSSLNLNEIYIALTNLKTHLAKRRFLFEKEKEYYEKEYKDDIEKRLYNINLFKSNIQRLEKDENDMKEKLELIEARMKEKLKIKN